MAVPHGQRSLEAVVALAQRPAGSRLAEVAEALEVPLSSAQRALATLIADGLVRSVPRAAPRYTMDPRHPAGDALTEFALRALRIRRAVDISCRANVAVEFAGRDHHGYVVVLSPFAEPADAARLNATFEVIDRQRPDRAALAVVERGDLRRRLLDDRVLRDRGLRLTVVKGSAVRTFRDPHRHGSFEARRLGRLAPSLPHVSRRALKRLAEDNRLARIGAFGSAVRADLRPDSDVDVVLEPKPGVRLGVGDLLRIQEQLEGLFGRDVDVVRRGALQGKTRDRVLREEVVLYGGT